MITNKGYESFQIKNCVWLVKMDVSKELTKWGRTSLYNKIYFDMLSNFARKHTITIINEKSSGGVLFANNYAEITRTLKEMRDANPRTEIVAYKDEDCSCGRKMNLQFLAKKENLEDGNEYAILDGNILD